MDASLQHLGSKSAYVRKHSRTARELGGLTEECRRRATPKRASPLETNRRRIISLFEENCWRRPDLKHRRTNIQRCVDDKRERVERYKGTDWNERTNETEVGRRPPDGRRRGSSSSGSSETGENESLYLSRRRQQILTLGVCLVSAIRRGSRLEAG